MKIASLNLANRTIFQLGIANIFFDYLIVKVLVINA